jgi:Uma2 family endonuclease
MGTYTELPLTVAALEGMPDDGNRYEVIEGELYVSTAPGFPHQSVLAYLFSALSLYLEDHPMGRVLWNLELVFDDFSGVISDLVFISHERLKRTLAGGRLTGAPEIVVEALSPGKANEDRDRRVKRKLYSTRGVSEYWILDPETRTIEVSRKRQEGGLECVAVLQAEDYLTSPLLPNFRILIAQLFE